jgi:hypothetical protein
MLLVPWKRLILSPSFLFQISNDVQRRSRSRLVAPKFAHLLNASKVMAQFAVAHCASWNLTNRADSRPGKPSWLRRLVNVCSIIHTSEMPLLETEKVASSTKCFQLVQRAADGKTDFHSLAYEREDSE